MPDRPMRADGSKRLTVLSEAERLALYGLPDFDDFQRAEFFALSATERALVDRRKGLAEQVWCLLQIGYFKAKQAFFGFSWPDVPPSDIAFLMERYFPGSALTPQPIRANEHYAQRREIAGLFGYRLWADTDRAAVVGKAGLLAKRDVAATFILTELLAFLATRRIVRPGYTTLQGIISEVLTAERRRLEHLVEDGLDEEARAALQGLLVREDTLSELAALKQDAKHFGYRMMVMERQKRATLAPLHRVAKMLLPRLDISQQNVAYYASLAHYYTVYDLRRLKPGQTNLYLLCYAWQRFRQLTDNLVEAFGFHMGQMEAQTKEESEAAFAQAQAGRQQEGSRIGRVLLLYVDDTVDDATPFGAVRHRAFTILPREAMLGAGQRLCEKPVSQLELRWQAVDRTAARCKKQLRPLAMALEVSATTADNPWLAALRWMKGVFSRQQRLAQRPLGEIPENTIPDRLRPHLLDVDEDGKAAGLRGDRYEFWIYRQLRKRLATGELHLDDSVRHRRFGDELVASDRAAEALRDLDSPWLRQPVDAPLDGLCADLHRLWLIFDRDLRQGKLKHLEYDPGRKTLSWRTPKVDKEEALQAAFYARLPARGIADIFHFVDERCRFLAALTPLQPRYAKRITDDDSLTAVILGQAMNHGNLGMAEISDIPYHVLEATHQQHLRLSTLKAANDRVSNFIAGLGIFPFYSFDPAVLYGSVDGQKFAVAVPTAKARHSRKIWKHQSQVPR